MAIHLLFFQTVLLFLSGSNCLLLKAHLCSCPLLGNLLSLQIINVNKYVELDEFSSPIGESIFSTLAKARENARLKKFSSPIGESIFSTYGRRRGVSGWFRILVPYWGIYFLYQKGGTTMFKKLFSSPIGESIFSTNKLGSTGGKQTILVPYRGIYFLYPASGTPLFIRVPALFCGAKFKIYFSFTFSYARSAFFLILSGAAQNLLYCLENSILPIPISYNFP